MNLGVAGDEWGVVFEILVVDWADREFEGIFLAKIGLHEVSDIIFCWWQNKWSVFFF